MSVTAITVYGYHGTSRASATALLRTRAFQLSANRFDWLGRGLYFFQDAPNRAWQFTQQPREQQRLGSETAVLGAVIMLPVQECIDLSDTLWSGPLRVAFQELSDLLEGALPTQNPVTMPGRHPLDRMVIDHLVERRLVAGHRTRAVRASFQEGAPIYADSALFTLGHVQIAVRDATLVQALWDEPLLRVAN